MMLSSSVTPLSNLKHGVIAVGGPLLTVCIYWNLTPSYTAICPRRLCKYTHFLSVSLKKLIFQSNSMICFETRAIIFFGTGILF